MNLKKLLKKQKNAITREWFQMVVDTYPADTSRFLKSQNDPFANPVGSATIDGLEGVFDELLGDMDQDAVISFLDPIIRIRAVQNFSPSGAAGFPLFLKNIIRTHIDKDIQDIQDMKDLLAFEGRIDQLGLIAFDIYMKCRETLLRIQATEERKRTFSAFERAGLIRDA